MSISPLISLIIRTADEMPFSEKMAKAISQQTFSDFEIVLLNSESSDGSAEAILAISCSCQHFQIKKNEYMPGNVLNKGISMARGKYIVFLNSDAIPISTLWLEEILNKVTDDPETVYYARQIPRKDAYSSVVRDYMSAFPPTSMEERKSILSPPSWENFLSIVCLFSATETIRKQAIPEDLKYSEDIAWSKQLSQSGISVAYTPDIIVEHSHNYNFYTAWKRFHNEGVADYEIFQTKATILSMTLAIVAVPYSLLKDFIFWEKHHTKYGLSFFNCIKFRTGQKIGFQIGLIRKQYL